MVFMLDEVLGKEVSITEGGEPVLTFSYGEAVSFSYFHPIYAPNGQVVTEGVEQKYPPGLCFTFGTVKDGSGKLVRRHGTISSPDKKSFDSTTSEDYVKFLHTTSWGSDEPWLTKTYKITVYPLQNDVRIFDVTVVLRADSKPLTFEGEIGLGYHAVEMEHRKAANASGKIGELEVNGQESEWATLCGIIGDAAVGLAILPHPENGETFFLAEDAYQGFLFAQTAPFNLNISEDREFKYRVLIYLGDLFTFDVWDYYQQYIDSETISVMA